jgi:hypothetical protein
MQGAAGGMSAAEARNIALAKAVWTNTSAVREGASALAKLDSSVLKDAVGSLLSDGEGCYRLLPPVVHLVRERERERESKKETESRREKEREREFVCVYASMYVMYVYVCICMYVYVCICILCICV